MPVAGCGGLSAPWHSPVIATALQVVVMVCAVWLMTGGETAAQMLAITECQPSDECAGGPTRITQHAIDTIVWANFPERAGLYKVVMWKAGGQMFASADRDLGINISRSMYMALPWNQLVAVMAHEVAHHEANHSLPNAGVGSVIWIADKVIWLITPWMILSGMGLSTSKINGLIHLASRRHQEMEADLMAVKYLENAGYSKDDYLDALTGLKEAGDGGGCSVWCTHPHIDDRIRAVREGRNVLQVQVGRNN